MTHCSLYFLSVHVWVTFTAGCFTFSHILVPGTVLSHLTFLLYIHLTNKSTSDFVYKEPCHSRVFFMLLGTWLVPAILSGMQGSRHLEIMRREKSYHNPVEDKIAVFGSIAFLLRFSEETPLLFPVTSSTSITGMEGEP